MKNCEQYEELFAGWINNELKPAEKDKLEQHLNGCEACREELASMQQLWSMMDEVEVPDPSPKMQTDFRAMLNDFKTAEAGKKQVSPGLKEQLSWLLQWRPSGPAERA